MILKKSYNDYIECWIPILPCLCTFHVSLMSWSYTILILLILALFPFISTSVSDLVTRALELKGRRIQRALALSSNWVMLSLPHSSYLPSSFPSTFPSPSQLLRPSIHQHPPTHTPVPAPPLPRLPSTAFEGQRSQNSLCSQHPHPP